MEKKKPTNGELEKRLRNAILHIDRTKDTQSVFFDDKGLELTITEDFAIIQTGCHRHVFNSITPSGVSRPYLYTKRFVEIALKNDCKVKDAKGNVGNSYGKLLGVLKEKEDKAEYNICWYIDLWLNNIFHPLYGIGETEAQSFLVYESYIHNIARNQVILSEKVNGMTNRKFVDDVLEAEKSYCEGIEEREIFPKKTDKELVQEEIDALKEQQMEKTLIDSAADGEKKQ